MTAPVLEVQGLQKYFPVSTGGLLHRRTGWVKAVDAVDFAIMPGETLGLIGESGCGKTTTAKLILLQEKPTAGSIRFEGEDILGAARRGADALPPRGAGGVPGPVQLAQPAHAGARHHRRAAGDPHRHVARRDRASAWPRCCSWSGMQPDVGRAVPARVQRRAAPAHRHRPGAGDRHAADRAGRAGVRARRVDPRADHEPAGASAGDAGRELPVHRPRPCGRGAYQPPHRGDVSRPARRTRRGASNSAPIRCIPTRRRC